MRTIWLNLDKSNQDFSKEDFTDAYFNGCNFTNSIFGVCVNATFIKCDLSNADFSNAIIAGCEFKDCTTDTIKFRTIATVNKIGKVLLDKFGLSQVYPVHAHTLIASIMKKEAYRITDLESRQGVLDMADFISKNPQYSWESFIKKISIDYAHKDWQKVVTTVFTDYPELKRKAENTIVSNYSVYPLEDNPKLSPIKLEGFTLNLEDFPKPTNEGDRKEVEDKIQEMLPKGYFIHIYSLEPLKYQLINTLQEPNPLWWVGG